MTMVMNETSPTPLLDAVEDEILALTPDETVLLSGAIGLAAKAKASIIAALAAAAPAAPAGSPRRSQSRRRLNVRSTRRAAARQLLVANPRAQRLAGIDGTEELSDAEIDALFDKLVDAGLLPNAKG